MVSVCIFAAWCLNNRFVIRVSKSKMSLFLLWTVYVLYTSASLIWSTTKESSTSNLLGMILLYMTSLVFFSTTLTKKTNVAMEHCWLLATAIVALMFVFGETHLLKYSTRETLVIFGTVTDANEFSSFFIVGVSIAVRYLFQERKRYIRLLMAVLLAVSLYVVLMTGSRGALLSVLVAIVLVVSRYMSLKDTIKISVGGLLTVLILWFFVLPNISDSTLGRFSLTTMLNDGGSGRIDIWTSAIKSTWEGSAWRWFVGNGYGRFGVYASGRYVEMMMHNQFLQQLISYGVIGLILYVAFLIKSATIIKKQLPEYRAAFWGVMMMSLTLTMGPSYKLLWFIFYITMMAEDKENQAVQR